MWSNRTWDNAIYFGVKIQNVKLGTHCIDMCVPGGPNIGETTKSSSS